MLATPVKISGIVTPNGVANDHQPDADILSLAAEAARYCSELDILDESDDLPDNRHNSVDKPDMMGARMAEIAADLDRLEKEIARRSASTIEGLKAKATAADAMRRFGYEKIQESIVRDLITSDSPLARCRT